MFSSGSQVLYLPGGTAARVSTGLTSPRPPAPPHPPPRTHLMAQPFHFTRYSMRPCKTHGGDAGVRPEPGGGGGGIVVAVGGSPPLPPAPGRAGRPPHLSDAPLDDGLGGEDALPHCRQLHLVRLGGGARSP